jgi:O-antigen/teichoic acid export membrane protein
VTLPVALLAAAMGYLRLLPRAAADIRLRRRFRAMALPLIAVSALTALIGDVAVVTGGLFLWAAQLGVFALASKIALLVGFVIQTVHQVGMPKIAAAHNHRSPEAIRADVIHINRSALAFACIAAIGIGIGTPLMQSWLGAEFAGAGVVLAVLIVVQLMRAYFGCAVPALVLVSANRVSAILSLATLAILLGAMAMLAPIYGELGAALALSVAMLFWSAAAAVIAGQRGVNTIGLGLRRPLTPDVMAKAFGKTA